MKLIALLTVLTLTGCATTQPTLIAPCPRPNLPAEPYYPVNSLKRGDSAATVAKAYVATVQLQHDYICELKHIYGAYK